MVLKELMYQQMKDHSKKWQLFACTLKEMPLLTFHNVKMLSSMSYAVTSALVRLRESVCTMYDIISGRNVVLHEL